MIGYELCKPPAGWAGMPLPPMYLVEQRFKVPAAVDGEIEVGRQWDAAWRGARLAPDASVAIGVGSRGIDGLAGVVRAVVTRLRSMGCHPFIVPAMGSHGGATREGELAVLAERGITEATVGAPVHATLDVVTLGEADGLPLFMDRLAAAADGIVLVNRVKPHTDFFGRFESGLLKMLVVGLGNEAGATSYHRHALERGLADVIATAGHALLQRTRVVLGVALIENQQHRLSQVHLLPADRWEEIEPGLLEDARALLPRLPVEDIDVLLVDEMGKDVSGNGIDPNVTGRSLGWGSLSRPSPRITRIVVRSLTPATGGNASGLGSVDCAPRRLVDQIDFGATFANALASCAPEDGKLPLTFASDRQALAAALATLRPFSLADLRLVHIRNTSALERIELSPGCLPHVPEGADVAVAAEPEYLAFDEAGDLHSRLM
jgi:hypothetical protein